AHRLGETDNLLHVLAFHVKRNQQPRNLGVRATSRQDLRHHGARLSARQRRATACNPVKRILNHAIHKINTPRDTDLEVIPSEALFFAEREIWGELLKARRGLRPALPRAARQTAMLD